MPKPFFKTRRERPEQELQILLVRSRLEPLVKRGVLVDYWSTPNELVGMLYAVKPWASQLAVKMGVKRGVPDLVLRAPGPRPVAFMELKSDGGTMSAEQRAFGDRTKALGLPWYLVRSVEDFDAAVKDWLG